MEASRLIDHLLESFNADIMKLYISALSHDKKLNLSIEINYVHLPSIK